MAPEITRPALQNNSSCSRPVVNFGFFVQKIAKMPKLTKYRQK